MVWLLPSTGRPQLCQEALDACAAAGMTSPAVLYVDGDPDGAYEAIRLPRNWTKTGTRDRQGLAASMNWIFDHYRGESHFGWLADDLLPKTPGFDVKLEEAAGAWGFACSADGWYSGDPAMADKLSRGHDMAGALCWGGDLVRAAGAWAFLPHVGIDTAWCLVISRLGCANYRPDVMVEHRNYRTGKRPKDATDLISVPETKYYQDGVLALRRFFEGGDMTAIVEKVTRARAAAGRAAERLAGIDEPWWMGAM